MTILSIYALSPLLVILWSGLSSLGSVSGLSMKTSENIHEGLSARGRCSETRILHNDIFHRPVGLRRLSFWSWVRSSFEVRARKKKAITLKVYYRHAYSCWLIFNIVSDITTRYMGITAALVELRFGPGLMILSKENTRVGSHFFQFTWLSSNRSENFSQKKTMSMM